MTIYVSQQPQFCVYLTIYSGNKLPPFYIGSTSIKRIKSGYHGTIKSKKYRDIWKKELKENPYLFRTIILYAFYSRKNALFNEYLLHKQFNVAKSDQFINMAIANKKFGVGLKGENSPNYGRKKTEEEKQKRLKTMEINGTTPKGPNNPMFGKKGKLCHHYGKKASNETRDKLRICKEGENNPMSIKVEIDGITYVSKTAAYKALGLNSIKELNRLLGLSDKLKFSVTINGITYSNKVKACKELGISKYKLNKLLKSKI